MPFTGNPTPHYNFGQYLGTDKSAWTDNNAQWATADTAIFGVEQKAETGIQTANNAQGIAQQANTAAVAAGNKVDVISTQMANIEVWTFGSFSNPNSSIYTAYNIRYWYNPTLNLLQINGTVGWEDANPPTNDTIVFRMTNIPDFVLPNASSYTFYNLGHMTLSRYSVSSHITRSLSIRIANNGDCTALSTAQAYSYSNNAYFGGLVSTYGFGSII